MAYTSWYALAAALSDAGATQPGPLAFDAYASPDVGASLAAQLAVYQAAITAAADAQQNITAIQTVIATL